MTRIITPPLIGETQPPEYVAYDEIALREPRLLVPGSLPIGMAKIDRANPITAGLITLISWDRLPLRDMVRGASDTAGGANIVATRFGRGQQYNATAPVIPAENSGSSLTAMWVGFITGTASDTNNIIGTDGGFLNTWMFSMSAGGGNDFRFMLSTNNENGAAVTINTPPANKLLVAIGSFENQAHKFRLNEQTNSRTTTGSLSLVGDNIKLFDAYAKTTTFLTARWNRCLSDAEQVQLVSDPYQFLIPA